MTGQISTALLLHARVAGFLYLVIIVFGIFSEVFVRANLVVHGDAVATAENILASKSLFKIGFLADSIMLLSDVAIAILFYVLLKPVNKTLSLMACAFRLTQAAVLGVNLIFLYAVLLLLNGDSYLSLFDGAQINGLVMLLLNMHSYGYDLGLLFFAVSNFILGYLIISSTRFPAVLGYGLQAAAVVYLIGSLTRFILPAYVSMVEPFYIVPLLAELSFCLWLLVKGIKCEEKLVR